MRGGVEQTQFDAVILAADTINLVPQYDRYKWTLSNAGEYSVASFRKKVDCCRSSSDATRTRWVNFIPIKVNIVAWKIKLNALPTRFNLSCRGIDIESLTCPTCEG
ncbi:RNA-directed DNA polymerase, eukaryota, partial [Tanacetum coccineum]